MKECRGHLSSDCMCGDCQSELPQPRVPLFSFPCDVNIVYYYTSAPTLLLYMMKKCYHIHDTYCVVFEVCMAGAVKITVFLNLIFHGLIHNPSTEE